MQVVFRCCEKLDTVSGVPRLEWADRGTTIKKVWKSIQNSLSNNDSVYIVHDEVSEDTLSFLRNNNNGKSLELVEVPSHAMQDRKHTFILLSLIKDRVFKEAKDDEILYIVEDDYLHTEDALYALNEPYRDHKWQGFVVPYDYPDRYTIDKDKPTMLFAGKHRHFRSVPSGTYTVAAQTIRWKESWPIVEKHAPHNPFVELFGKYGALCPIPGVATHLTPFHMSPVVEWKNVWNKVGI